MSIQEQDVQSALQAVVDPATGRSVLDTAQMKNLRIEGTSVAFEVELGYPAISQHAALQQALAAAVQALPAPKPSMLQPVVILPTRNMAPILSISAAVSATCS